MASHPGGAEILEKTKDQADITSLFETYHAFTNKESLMQQLKEYEVVSEPKDITTDYTEYHELTQRIKASTSLKTRRDIKAPVWFYIQNSLTAIAYVFLMYKAVSVDSSFAAAIAGACWLSIGFNIMHDASHYAISTNPSVNTLLSRCWNSFGLWNHSIWFFHHVYHHHSFTNKDTDPDVYHYTPFAKKNTSNRKTVSLGRYTQYLLPILVIFFPGFYIGQAYVYFMDGFLKKKLLKIKIPSNIVYYSAIEVALSLAKITLLFYCKWYVSLTYIIALNLIYHINIVGDHDTYETHVENRYTGPSFLRAQICNSGNFLTANRVWTHLFGGINYQIEHHLFPNVSHKHYPMIAPIVKEYCKEKNIPYVDHQSLVAVYISFLKMIDYYSSR